MIEAQSRGGPYYRTDVSVPISSLPAFLDATLSELAVSLPDGRPITYGHVGDGNVHLNIVPPEDWSNVQRQGLFRRAEDLIFDMVDRFGGSISAEHGIGRSKKRAFLERVGASHARAVQKLKESAGPSGLLSRGRIFDACSGPSSRDPNPEDGRARMQRWSWVSRCARRKRAERKQQGYRLTIGTSVRRQACGGRGAPSIIDRTQSVALR